MLRWFRREEKEEEPLRLPQEMIDARLGKIQRNCKWIRRVVLVLIAYCALNCLWSIGMAFTTSNDNFIEFYVNEKLPPNVVYGLDLPATAAKSMGTAKTAMACYFIVAIAGGIFGIWAYDTLQETLKDVANGKTPFSMTYVKRVKKMGVIFMLLRPWNSQEKCSLQTP